MKVTVKFLTLLLILTPVLLQAQNSSTNLDKTKLICPFENGMGREPKEAYYWNPPDRKVIMISQVDSIVRSCIKAKVVKAEPAEDNNYEIVINTGDHYFWYYGAMRPLVRRGQDVNAAQPLAIYTMGTELEFRMFKDEDMLDPRELLDCKLQKEQ